jgi:AcrR family transcriptional regulator
MDECPGPGGVGVTSPPSLPVARTAHAGRATTKQRLLDAATRLLVERGYGAVSIRAVTRAAGLSVSAAHYHFGSKEALIREAVRSRIRPLTRERLARLDALERSGRPSVEAVVEAFLAPAVEFSAGLGDAALSYRRLPASLHFVPMETVRELYEHVFGDQVERFLRALSRALPDRDQRDLALAFQLCIGAMVHATGGRAESFLGAAGALEHERLLPCLVRFVSQGIRASCPPLEAAPAEDQA